MVKFDSVLFIERGVVSGRMYLKCILCDVKYQCSSHAYSLSLQVP